MTQATATQTSVGPPGGSDPTPVQTPGAPSPGWYADPTEPHSLRYWDGGGWTQHQAPAQSAAGASAPASAPFASAKAETPVDSKFTLTRSSESSSETNWTQWLLVGGLVIVLLVVLFLL